MPKGLFGQTVFNPATGTRQGEMFDTSRLAPVSAAIPGSRNALDPRHTGKLFDKSGKPMAAQTESGHWVTIEGNHVLIRDPIGEGRGFSRAELHRKLIEHHNQVTGGGSYTAKDEWDLHAAAGGGDPFTFHKALPTEIKEFQQGRPELRSLFKVTQDAREAGGADAFGELGDRYLNIAEAKAGSPVRQALNTARASDDPEVRFMAAIHDHLPAAGERVPQTSVDPGKLRVGQSFKIQGDEFHVIEDADGFKVLSGPSDYPEVPVEALKKIPIDRGSFRAAKAARMKADEAAPFSRSGYSLRIGDVTPMTEALTLGQGLPGNIAGVPCRYFWREFIREGDFVHPDGDQPISVQSDTLRHWQTQFSRMKANGVKVWVPVDHKKGTADNRGYVEEMRIREGRLEGLLQLIGDDAVRDCARSEISVKVKPKIKDGKGNVYDFAIEHASLVLDPVIPGQSTFEPHDANAIAASRGQDGDDGDSPTYVLSRKDADMRLTPELTAKVKALVGTADVSDDNAFDKLLTFAEGQKTQAATLAGEKTQLSRDLEAKTIELSRAPAAPSAPKPPAPPSASEMFYLGKTLELSREEAIKAAGAEVVTKAQKRFLSTERFDAGGLTLSREAQDGDAKTAEGMRKFIDFCELLKDAKPPIVAGPRTTGQGAIELARREGEEDEGELPKVEREAIRARVKARMGKQPA